MNHFSLLPTAILLCVMGAVFLLSLLIFTVLSKAYGQYQERYLVKTKADLSNLYLFIEPQQLLVMNVSSMALLGLFGWMIGNFILAIGFAAIGYFIPAMVIARLRKKRVTMFNVQLVDALQAMANAFKAGLTFPQAVDQISKDAPAPLSQEFTLLVRELKVGIPLDEAILSMSERVGSDDMNLVAVGTNIARSLGGNMAEMFETMSFTIRERFRLEGRIDAITSQGRMQGWIVGSLPVALGLVLNYMRPDLMQPMLHHPFGYGVIAAVVTMEFIGMMIIRRIVNIEV